MGVDDTQFITVHDCNMRPYIMASHKMNQQSSRSHAIFTVHVTASTPDDPSEVTRAKLALVDLAGSERQSGTGAGAYTRPVFGSM